MNVHAPPPRTEAGDIRAALERVIASAEFRSSPQLVAFLRFVVETSLNGEADRIKASTIGMEALGRALGFDSQRDPIVRVEAQRLRRALSAYYEGVGADDPIIIDIPRGGYVPIFRQHLSDADTGTAPLQQPPGRRISRRPLGAGGVLAMMVIAAIVLRSFPVSAPSGTGAGPPANAPVIMIEPIQASSASASSLATALGRELAGALRRVQPVIVIADPQELRVNEAGDTRSGRTPGYRMSGSIDVPPDGAANVTLRLVANGAIAWTRDWRITDGERSLAAIARDAAVDVASSSGIVPARMRERPDQFPAGYRCLLATSDYMRRFDLAQHERVRDCLERTIAQDDTLAVAFAVLAFVYEREYVHDLPSRIDGPPAIERSLLVARRALALDPNNAISHLAMMENMYLQGDLTAAFAAGEKALALNPLDPAVAGLVGLRLFFGGAPERGAALLKAAAARFSSNPGWLDFGLFCLAYLQGDMATAARHADFTADSTFPYGLASRAIAAAAAGEHERARQTMKRLTTLYPGWRDPRPMLARFIRSPQLVDLLVRDLAAIARP